jgi:hypothetical protein
MDTLTPHGKKYSKVGVHRRRRRQPLRRRHHRTESTRTLSYYYLSFAFAPPVKALHGPQVDFCSTLKQTLHLRERPEREPVAGRAAVWRGITDIHGSQAQYRLIDYGGDITPASTAAQTSGDPQSPGRRGEPEHRRLVRQHGRLQPVSLVPAHELALAVTTGF